MFRRPKESPEPDRRRGGYVPGWEVPPSFSFPYDVVDVLARDPVRPALISVGSDGTVDSRTFADMARESVRWARLLLERSHEPGSRVVIALEPGTHWAASILGALRAGLLPVPIGVAGAARGSDVQLEQLAPSLVVADHRGDPALEATISRLAQPASLLTLEEAQWELLRVGDPIEHVAGSAEAPALIVYTAGRSHGRPRPVLHRHTATFASYVVARDWLGAGPGDLVWGDFDGGSAAALWLSLFGPWSAGATLLHLDRDVSAEERVELLERFRPTIAAHTPASLERLLGLVGDHDLQLPELRNVVTTGAPLSDALRAAVRSATGIPVLDGYGTAETGIVAFQPVGHEPRPGSVGVPAPGHVVTAVDERGFVAPVGVVGDLGVFGRPPSLCASYWVGWPPSEEVTDGSWTLTGDRAFVDQDGSLHLSEPAAATSDEASLLWRYAPTEPEWDLITVPPTASVRG